MTSNPYRIYKLNTITQQKIGSSIQIASLNGVVIELIKNALDAGAKQVSVALNYARGFCSVTDDGHGIPAHEFGDDGLLAQAYCTSNVEQHPDFYGRHGRFLTALAGTALLSITSSTGDGNAHVLWLNESGRLAHSQEDIDTFGQRHGTKVKVHNLFSKLPVRGKYLAKHFSYSANTQKEFDDLRYSITALILACRRSFNIDIQHTSPPYRYVYKAAPASHASSQPEDNSLITISAVTRALKHAGYLDDASQGDWDKMVIESRAMEIVFVASLEPVPHKNAQFVCLNRQPLERRGHPELFQAVNNLFDSSAFGNADDDQYSRSSSPVMIESLRRRDRRDFRKRIDRWPIFVMWITTDPVSISDSLLLSHSSDHSQRLFSRVVTLVETLTREFLTNHDFLRPQCAKAGDNDMNGVVTAQTSEQACVGPAPSSPEHNFGIGSHVKSGHTSAVDGILNGLPFRKSKPVFRPHSSQLDAVHVECENSGGVVIDPTNTNTSTAMSEHTVDKYLLRGADSQSDPTIHTDSQIEAVMPANDCRAIAEVGRRAQVKPRNNPEISRKPRSQHIRGSPINQAAANTRDHWTVLPRCPNLAVRSIAPLIEPGESLKEQAAMSRKREEPCTSICPSYHTCTPSSSPALELPRISKRALKHIRILGQVDRKFVLALVPKNVKESWVGSQLILIDQHAADERCKAEDLLQSILADEPIKLATPFLFGIRSSEIQSLETLKCYFARWKILYRVLDPTRNGSWPNDIEATTRIQVTSLPSAIAERCRASPKLLIDLLREESWSEKRRFMSANTGTTSSTRPQALTAQQVLSQQDDVWINALRDIPSGLLDMINSRACRSAVMFNDELTMAQCHQLINRLNRCRLPFQCAHGRPSMIVLADLASLPYHDALCTLSSSSHISPSGSNTGDNMSTSSSDGSFHNWPEEVIPSVEEVLTRPRVELQNRLCFEGTGHSYPLGLNAADENKSFGNAYHDWLDTADRHQTQSDSWSSIYSTTD